MIQLKLIRCIIVMFQILFLTTTTKSIDLRTKAIPFGPQLVAN